MMGILVLKLLLLSCVWTFGAVMYMIKHGKDTDVKNQLIVFFPWIIWFLFVMLFMW